MRPRQWALTLILSLVLLLEVTFPVATVAADPGGAGNQPPSLFGMTGILPDSFSSIAGLAPAPWSRLAREAGARVNRLEFPWAEMGRSNGLVNLSSADPLVSAAAANGLGVLGVLVGTPSWAGSGEANQVPSNLSLPFTHPDNYWARFVYNMVLHYRGQVRYWEIWNEPNLNQFWTGTPSDYYRLLKVAYQAAKAADPQAQILFGGLSGEEPGYLEQVLRAAEADPEARRAGFFFDVFSWHTYSRAAQHYDGTLAYREALSRHGLSKPIWITESNIPAWNDPSMCGNHCSGEQWHATLEEQASYVVQAYGYSLAADVKHVSMYRASDVGETSAWGLLKANGTPRPAYYAYSTVARYLQDAESASLQHGDGYDRVDVLAPGRLVSMLWSRGPLTVPAHVESHGQQALLVNKYGNWVTVKPDQDGRYILYLPAATANGGNTARDYVVGGEPYMLVQGR